MEMNWNLSLLDSGFTPQEYIYYVTKYRSGPGIPRTESKWYLDHISKKVIAVCPFCGFKNRYRFDLCTMKYWTFPRESLSLSSPTVIEELEGLEHHYCEHATLLDVFLHLNGIEPYRDPPEGRTRLADLGPEVPGVMKEYLDAGLGLKAVITCLPICRIEEDKFVPVHKAYILTYFLPERNYKLDCRGVNRAPTGARSKLFHEIYPKVEPWARFGFIIQDVDMYLDPYVERGDLHWMENNNFNKAFAKDLARFPFKGIEGRRENLHLFDFNWGGFGQLCKDDD